MNKKNQKRKYLLPVFITIVLTLVVTVVFSSAVAQNKNESVNYESLDKMMLEVVQYVNNRIESKNEVLGNAEEEKSFGAYQELMENAFPAIDLSDGYFSELPITLSGSSGDITTGDDLTVTDDASIGGTLTVTGAVAYSADLAVDTDDLFVDVSANTVGINTATPAEELTVASSSVVAFELGFPINVTATASTTAAGSLLDDEVYYFMVTAVNGNGETKAVGEQSVTPTGSPTSTALIQWDSVTGALYYNVWMSTTTASFSRATRTSSTSLDVATTTSFSLGATKPSASTAYVNQISSTGDSFIMGGNLSIGTSTASALLHPVATTEQLRLGYNALNYSSFTVSSGGDLTIAPSGGDTVITGSLDTGTLTQGGGKTATSTSNSTATLLATDFDTESYIEMTPNSAALTLTLPATSTLSALIPNDGDFRTVWLKNATTTSGITITLAAGTGMDLQEQSGQDLVIDDEDWGKLTFLRLTNTDMMVLFEELIEAD